MDYDTAFAIDPKLANASIGTLREIIVEQKKEIDRLKDRLKRGGIDVTEEARLEALAKLLDPFYGVPI